MVKKVLKEMTNVTYFVDLVVDVDEENITFLLKRVWCVLLCVVGCHLL